MNEEANPVAALSSYELRNLVAHLAASHQLDDVHKVLALETSKGRNAWYQTKLARHEIDAYARDVVTALTAAQAGADAGGGARSVGPRLGDEYRYALLLTSLNTLASTVPPSLLIVMVRNELFPTADALNYARRATTALQRAEALIELLPCLDEEQRSVTISEVRREIYASEPEVTPGGAEQSKLLASLVPYVAPAEAADIIDELTERLAEKDHNKESAYRFADPIRDLAGRMTPEQARRLFEIASQSSDELIREDLLPAIAEGADDELREQVLAAARGLAFARRRADVLVKLVDRFPPDERAQILTEATEAALEWRSPDQLVEMLDVAPAPLRARVLEAAIEAARAADNPAKRALAILRTAAYVADSAERDRLIEEAVEASEALSQSLVYGYQLVYLAKLARQLPTRTQQRVQAAVLEAARANRLDSERVEALAELADYAEEGEREALLAEAFGAFCEIDPIRQRFALRTLASRLPAPMLVEAFRAVQTIGDGDHRREARAALKPYLLDGTTADEIAEAVAAAREVHHTASGRDILIGLAQRVDARHRAEVLDAALDLVEDDSSTLVCDGIVVLAPSLDVVNAPETSPAWRRAVRLARDVAEPDDRSRAITALAACLDEATPERSALLGEALLAARSMDEDEVNLAARAVALTSVAAWLVEPERAAVLAEAARDARVAASYWRDVRRRLGSIAQGTPVRELAVVAARIAPDEGRPLAREVVRVTRRLPAHAVEARAYALADAAPTYREPHRSRILREAYVAARGHFVRDALADLAPTFGEPERSAALSEALLDARKTDGYVLWSNIARALSAMPPDSAYRLVRNPPEHLATLPRPNLLREIEYLAPVLFVLGGGNAIAEIASAIDDCGRWWP